MNNNQAVTLSLIKINQPGAKLWLRLSEVLVVRQIRTGVMLDIISTEVTFKNGTAMIFDGYTADYIIAALNPELLPPTQYPGGTTL